MTAAIRRFVLNCLYTLVKYGKQPHYIVATFDPSSLAACKILNLPCLDGHEFNTNPQVGHPFVFTPLSLNLLLTYLLG